MNSNPTDSNPYKKAELYNKHFQVISGIAFTIREIDVIACILHNRDDKKIASILSIAPRTVGTHVRNIMNKIGYSTRQFIIDMVEKSGKLQHMRQYYFHLVMQSYFENALKKIAVIINRSGVTCSANFDNEVAEKQKPLQQLIQHLKLANITFDDNRAKNNAQNGQSTKNPHDLYIISGKSDTKNNHTNVNDINQTYNKKDANQKTSPSNVSLSNIALLFDKNIDLSTFTDFEYIDFRNDNDYYCSVMRLIEKIINRSELKQIIQEFKNEYKALQKSWHGNSSDKNSPENKKFYHSHYSTLFSVRHFIILFFITAIFLLALYLIVENNHFSNKSQQQGLNISNQQRNINIINNKSWNLPQYPNHYTERKNFTKAIWDRFKNDNKKDKQRKTAILVGLSGLGGVGKTTLAANAIHNPENKYDFKGWFSAESKDLLRTEYFELGERHNLFEKSASDKQKIIRVKEWLTRKGNILLVYDNVPNMSFLDNYLPSTGDIIITSRNQKLPSAITIDVMTKDEAVFLLSKLIFPKIAKLEKSTKTDQFQNNKKELEILAQELDYLPLALAQAGAYISENNLTVSEYLKLYTTGKDTLLSDSTMPPMDKHKPVYVTWDMSIDKIKKHQYGEKAIKLLDFISYCYPDNIPKKLLMQYMYGKTDNSAILELNSLLALLKSYSLIKTDTNTLSIHRLVHHWLSSKQKLNKRIDILKSCTNAIEAIYPLEGVSKQKKVVVALSLIPHVNSFLQEIKKLSGQQVDKSGLVADNLCDRLLLNILDILGDIYFTLGAYKNSEKHLKNCLVLAKKYLGYNSLKVGKIYYKLGSTYLNLGDFSKSKEFLEKSLLIQRKYYGSKEAKWAVVLDDLGRTYDYLGKYNKSKVFLEESLNIRKSYYGLSRPEISTTLEYLGKIYIHLGNYTKSEKLLNQALLLKEKFYGSKHIKTARTLHQIGRLQIYTGHYIEARNTLQRTLNIKSNYYGMEHIKPAHTSYQLARVEIALGDYGKAEEMLSKALLISKNYYGNGHISTARIIHQLSNAKLYLHKYTQADQLFQEALNINENFHKRCHNTTAYMLFSTGCAYLSLEKYAKAEQLLTKSLAMNQKIHGEDHVFTANVFEMIGMLKVLTGKYHEGKEILEDVLRIITKLRGEDHPLTAKSLNNLGNAYRIIGGKENIERGIIAFEKALSILKKSKNIDEITVAKVTANLGISYGSLGEQLKEKEYLSKAAMDLAKHLGSKNPDVKKAYINLNSNNILQKLKNIISTKREANTSRSNLGYLIVLVP